MKRAATSRARRRSKAGFGKEVPGVRINRFCGSGLDAVNLAAAQVMARHEGHASAAVSNRCRASDGAPAAPGPSIPARHASYFVPQGISADLIATKYGFSRDDVDKYAVETQKAPRGPGTKGASPSPSSR